MEIISHSGLEERAGQGQEIYVDSMEKSADQKFAEINPWVKEGIIVDMGAGAGPITDRLSLAHPGSHIVAVDASSDMVERLKRRFAGRKNIEVIHSDMADFRYKEPVSTFINAAVFHERFSFSGYNHKAVIDTLRNQRDALLVGGRDIIRDGVKPEPEIVYVKPLNDFALTRFGKFAEGFGAHAIRYSVGVIDPDNLHFSKKGNLAEVLDRNLVIKMFSQDASELLSKYWYSEKNLPVELKEQFGIWTLEEYKKVLTDLGFDVVHAETFLLEYLLKEHYSKDFEMFHEVAGRISHTQYPPSTMDLVGEKRA